MHQIFRIRHKTPVVMKQEKSLTLPKQQEQ